MPLRQPSRIGPTSSRYLICSAWSPSARLEVQWRPHLAGATAPDGLTHGPHRDCLSSWPAGMRVIIVRRERPHSGARLRFTDVDGRRFTAFATDTRKGQLADLELRHRRRPRCEDRIRCAKDAGLRNLPLQAFAQNQLWCEVVALACELLAWTQMIVLAGHARRWEPKTPPAAPVLRRRPRGPRRPPAAAPPRRTLALGHRHHRSGHPPASPSRRLTSRN